jgi:N-acetylneuraminic acid mutarotase
MRTLLIMVLLIYTVDIFSQNSPGYNEDSHLVSSESTIGSIPFMGESLNAAGDWCPTGTFPDLPASTYFQEARWIGDTLYVHTPSTTGTPTNTVIKYTLGGSWTTGTPLPASLAGGAMTVANGKLFFLGGGATSVTTGPVNTVYQYDPATGQWTTMAPMPMALSGHGAVTWGDSVIFVVGGPWTGSGTNLSIHYYRIASNTWGTISNSLPSGQGRRSFGLGISGNKIIVAAGFNTVFLKNVFIGTIGSDASQVTWTAGPEVPTVWTGLSRPGAAAIDKYFFLVCGEAGGSPTTNRYYDTTHVMDVDLEQWVDLVNNKPVKMSNIWNGVAPRFHGDTIKVFVPGGYGSLTGATPGVGWPNFDAIACGNLIVIPVELTAFNARIDNGNVILNWQTATEINNSGFEIQRRSEGGYSSIGFVEGFGTTTETQNYSFIDSRVNTGTYFYRLKQIDFDGTFAYSDEIMVEVTPPLSFTLEQNFPNPFNPTTTIYYKLPENAFVTLKVFDILGNEVATLVNEAKEAGNHIVDFDASEISSGIYFYTIQTGNFTQTKKMTLMK